jgi:hypothetical protein
MKRTLKLLFMFLAVGATTAQLAAGASSPALSTGTASSITTSSAIVHGSVNPDGASTTYQFQYGLTNSYGLSTSLHSAGSGTKSIAVTATTAHLIPGTRYHYRIVASNKFGVTSGSDRTFKTSGNPPPDAATGPVSSLGTTVATLTGIVNPQGEATIYAFQYGLTTAYGVQTFAGSVPAGHAPIAIAQQLQGLAPGTAFHFRIIALHNGSIVQFGSDQTFFTYPSPKPAPRVSQQTGPSRARSAPYVFKTSGRVRGPSSIPSSLGCAANAVVRFFLGKRELVGTLMPVASDCTFSGQTVFHHLPGHGSRHRHVRLRVVVHFYGDPYLGPADARSITVQLG